MKIASGPPSFSSLFMTHQNRADHIFWPHLQKNKQKMKTEWTTHSWNNAIWLALRPCHMTVMHKINKLEKPGRPQGNFHALFGRSPTFYGHFRADVVTSEWSTRISSSQLCLENEKGNTNISVGNNSNCSTIHKHNKAMFFMSSSGVSYTHVSKSKWTFKQKIRTSFKVSAWK